MAQPRLTSTLHASELTAPKAGSGAAPSSAFHVYQFVRTRDHEKRSIIRLPDEETKFMNMTSSHNVDSDSGVGVGKFWRLRLRLLPKLSTPTDCDSDSTALARRTYNGHMNRIHGLPDSNSRITAQVCRRLVYSGRRGLT